MIARQTIPNLLTFARLLAVPAVLMLILQGGHGVALFWLFAAAALTDFLDGYLARKWQCTSTLGALLDPMADKLLVALLLLHFLVHTQFPFLPIILILLRELYVSGLREFLALRGIPLPVSKGGKWKTALQMLAIALLLGSIAFGLVELGKLGLILLWIAAALAVLSAVQYTSAVRHHLK